MAIKEAILDIAPSPADFVSMADVAAWLENNVIGLPTSFKFRMYTWLREASLYEGTGRPGKRCCRLNTKASDQEYCKGKMVYSFSPVYLARRCSGSLQSDKCPDIDMVRLVTNSRT